MKLFFLRLHFLFDIERHHTYIHTPFDFHRGFIVAPEWEIFFLLLFQKVAEIWYLKVVCLTERREKKRHKKWVSIFVWDRVWQSKRAGEKKVHGQSKKRIKAQTLSKCFLLLMLSKRTSKYIHLGDNGE